jgi:glucose-6-phosphate dehydrogenase assembly protein OpcA
MSDTPQPSQVSLREVERELTRQMKALQGVDEHPVQRARMSNLVIYCNSVAHAERLNTEIPDVVMVHPARVLLLVADPTAKGTELGVSVLVRALSAGAHPFRFSEQVMLTAGPGALDHLPFAVRALLIGDLPTNLWWAAPIPPPLAGPLLYDLGEHAQQIVYDSMGWREPARGIAVTANWLDQVERHDHQWRVASDINWRRLKYWRRMLTQVLEAAADRGAIGSVCEVLAEHGPHAAVQAWELMSWLTYQLDWKVHGGRVEPGVEMVWHFDGPAGESRVRIRRVDHGPTEVQRVRFNCQLNSGPAALDLVMEEGQRLVMRLEGGDEAPRSLTVPPHSPADLVGRQLSDREHDPVFRESMAVAQVMARSLLE